jgi:predicted Zn-dependent peptidase
MEPRLNQPLRRRRLALAAALLLSGGALPTVSGAFVAPIPAAGARRDNRPRIQFQDYRLKNGLRILLAPDRTAPIVSVAVTYNVGSRDERPGRSGFAHLFEHMMFQGSENVGRGEHIQLINDNGGRMNGTTNQDRTNYFETVPANQLEMVLFLEADRMRSLDISQANLDNQREVVKEEKRTRYDNQPGGGFQPALLEAAFQSFPYRHTTIGSMEDLDAATLADVRAFFKTYYAPNNAVIAIAGDFDPAKAKALIEKYFGPITAQASPPPVKVEETLHRGERRQTLKDPLSVRRRYTQAYVTVPGDSPDFPALSVLGTILGRGRTSRLYAPLYEARKATTFGAGIAESRGPSLFQVSVSPNRPVTLEEVEKLVDAEIARIARDGVTADELRRAKRLAQVAAISRVEGTEERARALSQYAVFFNDPGRINTYARQVAKVTAADVRRVAAQYLTKDNRAVVVIEPMGDRRDTAPSGEEDVTE